MAIAGALYRVVRRDGRTRAGLALLVTWAICSGLLAFFADNPKGTPVTGSGVVHVVLAVIAFTCITIGAILISASLMSDPAWRPAAPVLLAISVAGALAYLVLGAPHKHYHAPSGLYERIFLGLELLWMAVAAIAVARRTRHQQAELTQPDKAEPTAHL
jgi:drug/metabolite transporter (DMT)-like permease